MAMTRAHSQSSYNTVLPVAAGVTAGYIYNTANANSTCAAAACSMATPADFAACCKKRKCCHQFISV